MVRPPARPRYLLFPESVRGMSTERLYCRSWGSQCNEPQPGSCASDEITERIASAAHATARGTHSGMNRSLRFCRFPQAGEGRRHHVGR